MWGIGVGWSKTAHTQTLPLPSKLEQAPGHFAIHTTTGPMLWGQGAFQLASASARSSSSRARMSSTYYATILEPAATLAVNWEAAPFVLQRMLVCVGSRMGL